MSGQFDTESGGTVGIYRNKDRYTLFISNPSERAEAAIELTKDELYRLIYMASPELRTIASVIRSLDEGECIFEDTSVQIAMERWVKEIPTEAEINKRRRAARRKKRT